MRLLYGAVGGSFKEKSEKAENASDRKDFDTRLLSFDPLHDYWGDPSTPILLGSYH